MRISQHLVSNSKQRVPTSQQGRSGFAPATRMTTRPLPLTPGQHPRKPAPMTTLETATEHRCEALTISDIPPYRCTTNATADRRGRAVCASHARDLRIHWFDDAADHQFDPRKARG